MEGHQIIEEIEKRLMFSCNVMENQHCIDWLTDGMTKDDESYEQLFQPNVDQFRELFGQHQFSFQLDKEYFVWRLQKGADKMYCISHEEGTFYEIFYSAGKKKLNDDEKMGSTIIAFLDYVLARLSSTTH